MAINDKDCINIPKTRREFLKTAGQAAVAVGAGSMFPIFAKRAFASRRDHILIGHPNPSTGPLADFGAASPWADEKALAAINAKGGIFIKEVGRRLPVRVRVADTESNPTRAAEIAARLIVRDRVDLMVVMHTPDTVNPVTAMCERYEMPCIALDAPVEAWLTGGPYKWSYHAFWTVDTITDLFADMWDQYADQTTRVVGGFWPNDPDGISFSEFFKKKLPDRGYKVIDPGRFPYSTRDFSSFINMFRREKVDIITGALIAPDWATAWRQCHQQGFVPKIATIAKAILFPSAVEALGRNLPMGLTSEVWWSPYHPFKSSLTGETSRDLCDAWTKESGQAWTQPIGFKYAGFEIAYDVLSRAQTLDKTAVLEALSKTDMNTIVGPIKYNEKNYAETPLVGGQWMKGKKYPWELEIVHNMRNPEIPKTAEMIFPLTR